MRAQAQIAQNWQRQQPLQYQVHSTSQEYHRKRTMSQSRYRVRLTNREFLWIEMKQVEVRQAARRSSAPDLSTSRECQQGSDHHWQGYHQKRKWAARGLLILPNPPHGESLEYLHQIWMRSYRKHSSTNQVRYWKKKASAPRMHPNQDQGMKKMLPSFESLARPLPCNQDAPD